MPREITGMLEPIEDAWKEGLTVKLSEKDLGVLARLVTETKFCVALPWIRKYNTHLDKTEFSFTRSSHQNQLIVHLYKDRYTRWAWNVEFHYCPGFISTEQIVDFRESIITVKANEAEAMTDEFLRDKMKIYLM